MVKIDASEDLRSAIRALEEKQAQQKKLLAERFHVAADNINPVNILNNTLQELVDSHEIKANIWQIATRLLAGVASRRILSGMKESVLKRNLDEGITTLLATAAANPNQVKTMVLGAMKVLSKRNKKADAG